MSLITRLTQIDTKLKNTFVRFLFIVHSCPQAKYSIIQWRIVHLGLILGSIGIVQFVYTSQMISFSKESNSWEARRVS